ncbi:MAG: hypothetical protein ABSE73_06440 [Planctomycetota bacterium]
MSGNDVDAPKLAVTGILTALAFFLLIIGFEALYYRLERAETEAKLGTEAPLQLRQVEAQQYGQLHSYRWVDAQKKSVAIPIERAIELLVQESGKEGGP